MKYQSAIFKRHNSLVCKNNEVDDTGSQTHSDYNSHATLTLKFEYFMVIVIFLFCKYYWFFFFTLNFFFVNGKKEKIYWHRNSIHCNRHQQCHDSCLCFSVLVLYKNNFLFRNVFPQFFCVLCSCFPTCLTVTIITIISYYNNSFWFLLIPSIKLICCIQILSPLS